MVHTGTVGPTIQDLGSKHVQGILLDALTVAGYLKIRLFRFCLSIIDSKYILIALLPVAIDTLG